MTLYRRSLLTTYSRFAIIILSSRYLAGYIKIEIFILHVVLVLYKISDYSGLPDFVLTFMDWESLI